MFSKFYKDKNAIYALQNTPLTFPNFIIYKSKYNNSQLFSGRYNETKKLRISLKLLSW